jgi:hypothetical protein
MAREASPGNGLLQRLLLKGLGPTFHSHELQFGKLVHPRGISG